MLDIASNPTSIEHCGADDLANMFELFQQLEIRLIHKLNQHPNNTGLLQKLADCKRKLGKIDEAIELYQTQLKLQPDNILINYTLNALQGNLSSVLEMPPDYKPAPLVKVPRFLSTQVHQEILTYMQAQQQAFSPTQISLSAPHIRNNIELKGKHTVKAVIRDGISSQLYDITKGLGINAFKASFIEVKLRAYRNGEYFRTHHDGDKKRNITFVYFLYHEPKAFEGGELILFDSNTDKSGYCDQFTRIVPENKTLFLFPSHFYHAVLPVKTEGSSFLSARFVINGHIQN